jgi:hypothetical protein
MSKILQRSALALLVASSAAAAFGAWQPSALRHFARLARPHLAEVSLAEPTRKPEILRLARPQRAMRCDLGGCPDAAAESLAELCPACLDVAASPLPTLDRTAFGETFAGDPNAPLDAGFASDGSAMYLVSFTPSGTAAPTPEISTSAMLTLGFFGAVWFTRRARRTTMKACPVA